MQQVQAADCNQLIVVETAGWLSELLDIICKSAALAEKHSDKICNGDKNRFSNFNIKIFRNFLASNFFLKNSRLQNLSKTKFRKFRNFCSRKCLTGKFEFSKHKNMKFSPVRASVMKIYGFAISKSDRSSFSSSTSSIISMISYFSDRPSNRLLLLDECS